MGSYLTGIGIVVGLMVTWMVVQSLWRNMFSDHISDEDVLAGRSSCGDCGCSLICKDKLRHLTKE